MELCNRFLTSKLRKLESGRLSPRTLEEYRRTTDRLVRVFGKNRPVADLWERTISRNWQLICRRPAALFVWAMRFSG